ncbi:hypothetical protein EST38_g234 [Candolleomyces aberdarensis]|uniref:Uncharacterized protein n=1 Tax=Candolleomyces aberdarensis TaxID=2316362 RepID=A0A4Q2E016_9AGAR|nr:hypothetical protein EST38_g234 [Candolleomyces aberdarensis]
MRPTLSRLYRILPRESLKANMNEPKIKILPRPTSQLEEHRKPTTIDLLLEQKEKAGEAWPANIRIEPAIRKAQFKGVRPEHRKPLKALMKET